MRRLPRWGLLFSILLAFGASDDTPAAAPQRIPVEIWEHVDDAASRVTRLEFEGPKEVMLVIAKHPGELMIYRASKIQDAGGELRIEFAEAGFGEKKALFQGKRLEDKIEAVITLDPGSEKRELTLVKLPADLPMIDPGWVKNDKTEPTP